MLYEINFFLNRVFSKNYIIFFKKSIWLILIKLVVWGINNHKGQDILLSLLLLLTSLYSFNFS